LSLLDSCFLMVISYPVSYPVLIFRMACRRPASADFRHTSIICDPLIIRHRPLAPLPLSHGACTKPASPAPSLRRARLNHARGYATGSIAPAAAVPSNPPRCATAQASIKPLACLRLAGATVWGV
jgi:hypothetical protein